MSGKVVILGMDGLTFDCVDPLVAGGVMPNLGRMLQEGCSAVLRSAVPHSTAPAWVSLATGCHPGKHGCFDFLVPHGALGRFRPVTSADIRTQTFYECLENAGRKVILINLPVSYPPRVCRDDQVVITSLMTQGPNAVFPESLKERFPVLERYRIFPDPAIATNGTADEAISDIRQLEQVRFECARVLFQDMPWDCFFYMISGTDWIQHRRHRLLRSPRPRPASPEARAFADFDGYLGWFRDHLPQGAHLLLVSDHGFTLRRGIFYLNTWLWRRGYLRVDVGARPSGVISTPGEVARRSASSGIRFTPPGSVLAFLGRHPVLGRWTQRLYGVLKGKLGMKAHLGVGAPVPSASRAFCPWEGMWGIYLNDARRFSDGIIVDEGEYQRLRREIQEGLSALRDPFDGAPVFDSVRLKEEEYQGPWSHLAPDIVLASTRFQLDTLVTRPDLLFRAVEHQGHSPWGVLAAWGPQVLPGARLPECAIVDVAPTVLHLMDVPIPADRDGRILLDMYRESAPSRHRAPRWAQPAAVQAAAPALLEQDEEAVMDRLRSLGYL
jgi:predicted AlkP superfamily phosphohydrolase/phosphomutase